MKWFLPFLNVRYGLWMDLMVLSTFMSTPPRASTTCLKPPKSMTMTWSMRTPVIALHGLHHQRQAAPGEGRIDLRHGVAEPPVGAGRHEDVEVTREGDDVRLVVAGRDVHQHDGVGAGRAGLVHGRVRVPRVAAQHEDVERAVHGLGRAVAGERGERVGAVDPLSTPLR